MLKTIFLTIILVFLGVVMANSNEIKGKPNHLINESSYYLRQHAYNPVDWYPWGKEAFEKAKKENKPIFLSIGYSTCHWCHVMEKECFEDKEVAEVLNKFFVCIKVDREERPDIDNIYMDFAYRINGSGGWPLNLFLTPDRKPFFAATYIPKHTRGNRTGLIELAEKVGRMWRENPGFILQSADKITTALKEIPSNKDNAFNPDFLLNHAVTMFKHNYDSDFGGFGFRPKFPTPHNYLFLLMMWKKTKDKELLNMVINSLTQMRLGGIYDHIGGGFHRYSVDRMWRIPHFEKMLYDQAMLVIAYSECCQATKNTLFKETVGDTLAFCERELQSENGGFYSAIDADSEGQEGKFYLWSKGEVENILGKDADFFCRVFNVDEVGVMAETDKENTPSNVLSMSKPYGELAKDFGMNESELKLKVRMLLEKLYRVRENRIRPFTDKKILLDWNSLMLVAYSKAYQATGDERFKEKAKSLADFLLKTFEKNGEFYRVFNKGELKVKATVDDYAFLVWGLLEYYQCSFDTFYLKKAIDIEKKAIQNLWDDEFNCFDFSLKTDDLILPVRKFYDGAIPSGNSVMYLNLVTLYKITGDDNFKKYSDLLEKAFAQRVKNYPMGFSMFLCGVYAKYEKGFEIVINGELNNEEIKKFLKELHNLYLPNKVVLVNYKGSLLSKVSSYVEDNYEKSPEFRICSNFSCKVPVYKSKDALKLIETSK